MGRLLLRAHVENHAIGGRLMAARSPTDRRLDDRECEICRSQNAPDAIARFTLPALTLTPGMPGVGP